MIVWDHKLEPPAGLEEVLCWKSYSQKQNVGSILQYVENHAVVLRAKYLSFIHNLGESRVNGKRLIDHLTFEDGLSYWWMTLFVEKSLYRSPIADAIRLFAFEEIVIQQKPGKIKLVSDNRWLHETISGLCRGMGIDYEWEQRPIEQQSLNRNRIYQSLPVVIQALLSLARYLRVGWPFKRAMTSGWFKGSQALFLCGYFANIVPEEAATGHFHSRYWEDLHGLLQQMGIKGNWLHHNAATTSDTALEWVQHFNRNRQDEGFHTFLNAYLSWLVAFRVLKHWLWLSLTCWRLRDIKDAFLVPGTYLSLWPLMQEYWETSMWGPAAISNLFSIELFDAALRDLPQQKKGLYLCEGNSWERAMIHAWRKHGHGQLIAVAHATVRFWDLGYYTDPNTIQSADQHPIPQPDLTALNGKAAIDAYLSVDHPKETIVECEALRYGYLNNIRAGNTHTQTEGNAVKVLILGDLLLSSTIKLMKLIEATVPRMAGHFTYTVKPHPVCPVKPADFPGIDITLVTEPLGKLLKGFDIAFSSNSTTAAVDAYLAGLPVVVMLDDNELNISPLRGQTGVRFVSTPEELAEAIQSPGLWAATNPDRNEFFFLDPDLPRWRRLLSSVANGVMKNKPMS